MTGAGGRFYVRSPNRPLMKLMAPVRHRALLLPLLLLLSAASSAALDLRGEFWVRRDMMDIHSPGANTRETGGYSDRERAEMETLLDDARWAFSGMIYGFEFTWTPGARGREVDEELVIEPLGLLPWGDPRLDILDVVEENGFLYVQLRYIPDETQQSRLEGWNSQAYPVASGAGEVRALSSSRRDAMEQAIKESVRAWLRAREYNRPREVTGKVTFTEFPLISLRADSIRAAVSVRMILDPLRHYGAD